jgi:hypothetical protein
LQLPDHENNNSWFGKKEDPDRRDTGYAEKKLSADKSKKSSLTHEQATKKNPASAGFFFARSPADAHGQRRIAQRWMVYA